MGKKQKSISNSVKPAKKAKGLKAECCEKYLKKGAHKRCKRCPCFDIDEKEQLERFQNLENKIFPQNLKLTNKGPSLSSNMEFLPQNNQNMV